MPFFGGAGDYKIIGTNIKGSTTSLAAVTGNNNIALGIGAGQNITTGSGNVLLGNAAGEFITYGGNAIFIGNSAGNTLATDGGSSCIIIDLGSNSPVPLSNYGQMIFIGSDLKQNFLPPQDSVGSILIGNTVSLSHVNPNSDCVVIGNSTVAGYGDVTIGFTAQGNGNLTYSGVQIGNGANGTGGVSIGQSVSGATESSIGIGRNINCQGNGIGILADIGAGTTVLANQIKIGDASHTSVNVGAYAITASSLLPAPGFTGAIPYWNGAAWAYDSVDLYYIEATNTLHVGALAVQQANNSTCTVTNTSAQSPTQGGGVIGFCDSGSAMLSGNRLAHFTGGGAYNATHSTFNAASMTSFASENWSATAHGADLRFEVTKNTTAARFEAFRISNSGALGIAGANYGTAGQSLVSNGPNASPSWSGPSWPASGVFNAASGSLVVQSIRGATMTRTGAGTYAVTFTTPQADTNYGVLLQDSDTVNQLGHSQIGSVTVNGFTILHYENQALTDTGPNSSFMVFRN